MTITVFEPENQLTKEEWASAKCDKYDYLIAVSCGAIAGLVDVFFVGAPGLSTLGSLTDAGADELVKKFAQMSGWSPNAGNENNISSAIGFLERNFSVNYDQRHTADVGGLFNMTTRNHHFKSLGHSPSPVGLFFSILDQFMNTSSFLHNGQLIRIDTSGNQFYLEGGNFFAKLFSGFCNWIGHIMSDLAGSSGSRGLNSVGRGTGVPLPFMELFGLCNFGSFQIGDDRQNLATLMTRVFQEGYDARFGVTMSIPVLLESLMIRVIWALKTRFYHHKPWSDCIPSGQHADLRVMLLVGNGMLCLVDGVDAVIRSGGNPVAFVLHLNLIAWVKLVILILKELYIRYGPVIKTALEEFFGQIMGIVTPAEKKHIAAYYARMQEFDQELAVALAALVAEVDAEYQQIHAALEAMTDLCEPLEMRKQQSVKLAQICKVSEEKIIHNFDELDDFMLN